jgi:hypothetical protein
MSNIEYLDRPPAGEWFPLDVFRRGQRGADWSGLSVDVHPDELKHCHCEVAFLFVDPDEYRPEGNRTAREVWLLFRAGIAAKRPHGMLCKAS